jgi:probable HAF family extracellular repeat protein
MLFFGLARGLFHSGTVVGLLAFCQGAHAQGSIVPVGGLPGYEISSAIDVSADGSVVAGTLSPRTSQDYRPFRWVLGGKLENLGTVEGFAAAATTAVSADGAAVVGYLHSPSLGRHAFRWTEEFGMEDLGPGNAIDVSEDGRTVLLTDQAQGPALWTRDEGRRYLGVPANAVGFEAIAMTSDASTVAGSAYLGGAEWRAALWRADTGFQSLQTIPGASRTAAISVDGNAVTGRLYTGISHFFRWTPIGGMEDLGRAGGYSTWGVATSGGGSILVGRASLPSGVEGVVRTRTGAVLFLAEYLEARGIDTSAWQLGFPNAVSDNGATIVGEGIFLDSRQGWIARLSHCAADINFDGASSSQDFFDFLDLFFAADPGSDFNADGVLNTSDFFDFLTAFFAGCQS